MNIEGLFQNIFNNKCLKEFGQIVARNVLRASASSQTIGNGRLEPLPPLAESTIRDKLRRGVDPVPRLRNSKPPQLMRPESFIIETSRNSVEVRFDRRPRKKASPGTRATVSNEDVAGFIDDPQDGYLGSRGKQIFPDPLDKRSEKEITDIIVKKLNRLITK